MDLSPFLGPAPRNGNRILSAQIEISRRCQEMAKRFDLGHFSVQQEITSQGSWHVSR